MLATLYREELKATLRGRFAWVGAAVLLLAVGVLATVATQDTWLDGYGIIAYGIGPLAFIPIAAGMIASPRVSRFVECVFTAPVRRRDWLAAKVLVLLTLATGYYLALVPMMLVYAAHVGFPPLLVKLVLWAPGLLLASVAAGTLIGVLFMGNSLTAPAGAGMGVLMAYAGLLPIQELMVAQGNGASRTGHLTLMSPAVMLKNALHFALAAANIPAATGRTWISLGILVAGTLILAFWVFLRAQGVETWEAGRRQRWTVGLALAGLILLPTLLANTNYDLPTPAANSAPTVRVGFGRSGMAAALVAPGAGLPPRCCSLLLNRQDWPLATGRATTRDLLLLLPVSDGAHLTNLATQLTGADGLAITAAAGDLQQSPPRLERGDLPPSWSRFSGGLPPSGVAVARIPVVVTPTRPWDVGGDRYPLTISTSYTVAGQAQPHSFTGRALIAAQIPNVIYQMGLAALLLPLFCIGAALRRSWRTR